MIQPIKPGDDLFPYDIKIVDGQERARRRKDWDDHKQVALNIRTIEYLLQFKQNRGSISLINMIESDAMHAMKVGDEQQQNRFREFMMLREEWLRSQSAA